MITSLDEVQVEKLFSSCSNNYDVLLGLYALAVPNWDDVEYVIDGKPRIGEEGWRKIYSRFKKFDEMHHDEEAILPGGIWLGQGFAMDKKLAGWEVDTSEMKLKFRSS